MLTDLQKKGALFFHTFLCDLKTSGKSEFIGE